MDTNTWWLLPPRKSQIPKFYLIGACPSSIRRNEEILGSSLTPRLSLGKSATSQFLNSIAVENKLTMQV
jgi:hypothetical protein